MQRINTIDQLEISNNQNFNGFYIKEFNSITLVKKNSVIEMLTSEGCESFVDYIESLGLNNDPNLVVLSSLYHYYYDSEEMKHVNTVINLKELNQIKEIKNFLHSIYHNLSPKSNFIGCFVDNKDIDGFILRNNLSPFKKKKIVDAIENGIMSRVPFLNRIFSLMDSRTNHYMSRANVTLLLKEHGFNVLNMTGISGLTYFCAQSLKTTDN
jgi:hypothetical protein